MMPVKPKYSRWDKTPLWLIVFSILVLLFLVTPVVIIIPMSFGAEEYIQFPPKSFSIRWYDAFFSNTQWVNAAWNSIKIAIFTTLASCTLGILAALGITNKALKKGSGIINIILLVPMILPSIIVAISMYMVYGQWKIVGTFIGLVVAHTCLAIPIVVTIISASLYGIDSNLYNAARSLGANHFTALYKVVLPLIKPAIFTSLLFAFITSFDESVISVFLAKGKTTTLPKLIFNSLKWEISPSIAAVSTILITITLLLFVLRGAVSKNKT